jgi:TRAP-type C4-dicarboxylate transport system permease small subunit
MRAKGEGTSESIDRAFDRVTGWLERALAYTFVGAVCLNFANVVGRYVVGYSIQGADELQIYAMVYMTFIGAVVVTWRNQHLRMDVLVEAFPARIQKILRWLELALFGVLSAFMLYQSFVYSRQMLIIGRTSDMAGVPMWIPHGAVAIGFGLILLITLWRALRLIRGGTDRYERKERGIEGPAR